ncbi:MAG: glycosyltransferase [Flavobacterium sp.]
MSKYIAFFVSSFNVGGVERAFVNLANGFVASGHKVDFIANQDIGQLRQELDEQVNVIVFKDGRLRKSVFQLYKYIKGSSVDCLIAGPTYPNIIALIANLLSFKKTKVIVSQHSYQDIEMSNLGLIGRLAPFLIKLTYNFAHKVVTVSEGVRRDMIANYNVRSDKAVTIYNAVLDAQFYQKSNEKVDSINEKIIGSKPFIVAVGRLEVVKNYSFMLKTFARIKSDNPDFPFDLLILGEGAERSAIENKIKELNLQNSVYLLGTMANPLPIIKRAKLFIHTSFSEAMPLVYVEVLALKVPVVTINNKGAEEILMDVQPKEIVDSHDEQKFIAAIIRMLDTKFATDDFPKFEQFESEKIKDLFLEII